MTFGADHAGQSTVESFHDLFRNKRQPRTIDKRSNTVFLSFRHGVGKAIELFGPHRVLMCFLKIKQPCVEDSVCIHFRMIGLDDFCISIEAADDLARSIHFVRSCISHFVEDHNISKFDLVSEQVHKRALILFPHRFPPIFQEIMAGIVIKQVGGIHHGHHGVDARYIRDAVAEFIAKIKGRGNG